MSQERTFNPRLIGGIAAAGIAAFAAFVLLLAFGANLAPSGGDGRPHPLSNSAIGFSGIVRLAATRSETLFARRESDLHTEDLLVVPLQPETDRAELARLVGFRRGRPTLFILPKWITMPDENRRSWVRWVDVGSDAPAIRSVPIATRVAAGAPGGAPSRGAELMDGIEPPVPAFAQTATAKDLRPVLTTRAGGILIGRLGEPEHYLVADPDLLNNHGIANPRRAAAAVQLLEALSPTGAEAIHFDLTLSGFGTGEGRNLLQLLFQPPFLVMTLALVVAAFLAGYHGLNRFGPARREERAIAFGKAALVENSAGLIRQARRETQLGDAYVDVVRQEAARITAAPRGLAGEALDEYLNRFSPPGGATFAELARRLLDGRDRDSLVAAARALANWKKELIR